MFKKVGTQVFIALICISTLFCLFPPSTPFFLWWEAQASIFMIVLLGLGLAFFIVDRKRLMATAFGACAMICFFINTRTETILKHPALTKEGMDFSAAHFKFPDAEQELEVLLDKVQQFHPDLLSLQNLNSDQVYRVHQFLAHQGYEHLELSPIDSSNEYLAVYSRYPLDYVRQINQRDDASITGRIQLPEHMSYSFLQFTTAMPRHRSASPDYLNRLAAQIRSWNSPSLALGDFSCVPWSLSLSNFKRKTSLQDSRKVVEAATSGEYMGLFEKPTFHILHSQQLHCIDFDIIRDNDSELIGIMGTYRLSSEGKEDVPQKN